MTSLQLWRERNGMNRLLVDLEKSFFGDLLDTEHRNNFTPATDVSEGDNHYLFKFDLPGLKKEDIAIEFENGILHLSGERRQESDVKEGSYKHYERSYGRFERSFRLPEGIGTTDLEAKFEDGVLSVIVSKPARQVAQKIEIQDGKKEGLFQRLLKKEPH